MNNSHSSNSVYLGIDTGGTFTDGVLLEPDTRKVIKTAKVLTTHQDLKVCIREILEKILPEDPSAITLVSLSTTLATNAIAEGKQKPVALLLLGYDPHLIQEFNFQEQFGTPNYFFIDGRHNLNGIEQVPLDEAKLVEVVNAIKHSVEAFAISSYAGPRNASHEERAAEIVSQLTDLPIVQAHHLSNELDSIRRATTVSLNAALLSSTREFMDAVQGMLNELGIDCPVMIVRGDGSIVKAEFARKRPVEIIHSGPATSAIGGQFLAKASTALVVDVGGTTTDLAMIENGQTQVLENAATVGLYRTCVRTIKAHSFGLGGDSLIRFDHTHLLSVGPQRVIPFSHFAALYPQVKADLADWLKQKGTLRYSEDTWYVIYRRPPLTPFTGARTQKVLEILQQGPQRLSALYKKVGAVSPIQINLDDMIRQEIVEIAALTPTDLLHLTGEFQPWDTEAARMLVHAAANTIGGSDAQFITRVHQVITRRILEEILQFISGKDLSTPSLGFKANDLDRWLFDESFSPKNPFLASRISLRVPLVGIGAPAEAFLPAVAKALGTDILLPEHYEVANAIGTVVGNVIIRHTGEVAPDVEGTVIKGYYSRVANQQIKFERFDEALADSKERLTHLVAEEACLAGAIDPKVEVEEEEVLPEMIMHLAAWAAGKPNIENN